MGEEGVSNYGSDPKAAEPLGIPVFSAQYTERVRTNLPNNVVPMGADFSKTNDC